MRFENPTLIDHKQGPCEAVVGSPVRSGHLPNWLRLRLLKVLDPKPSGIITWAVMTAVREQFGRRWLDHWGSTHATRQGQDVVAFVSEPYAMQSAAMKQAIKFADAVGCEFCVTATSVWYPTRTLRLLFVPAAEPGAGAV